MSLLAAQQESLGSTYRVKPLDLPTPQRQRLLDTVGHHATRGDIDYPWLKDNRFVTSTDAVDYLFALPGDEIAPEQVFHSMRWGGRFVFASTNQADVLEVQKRYALEHGFVLERSLTTARCKTWGLPLPLLGRKVFYFIARKVTLIPRGEYTERFTFQVDLARDHVDKHDPHGFSVRKRIPTVDDIFQRLCDKHPETDEGVLRDRAEKLTRRIFPIFLSREAGFLKLLQRDMPKAFRSHVPKLLHVEKNDDGMVKELHMTWLRLGGPKLEQIDFAQQATNLLHALHESVRLIHLDLRMDNMVITPQGVGFVDFGSAVRIGEDISQNKMMSVLFDEMMSTSQIQRLLGRMKTTGRVTSKFLINGYGKVDKAADIFYLAMQMNQPHTNPDLKPFIKYDKGSETARQFRKLNDAIMRPIDEKHPPYTTAKDLLRGIDLVKRKVEAK